MDRRVSESRHTVSRRTAIGVAAAVCTGAVAGCLGETDETGTEDTETDDTETDDTETEETEDGDDGQNDGGSEVDEETRALAEAMVEAIDDDLSVEEWRLNGTFVPVYTDGDGVEADVPILGDAYADVVEQGFDRRAMPTAHDDEGTIEYMVLLELEWATAYLDGDWSEEEYYAAIEDSEH